MDLRLNTIASICRTYLTNWEHVSRMERTEQLIEELHEATRPKEPPALGISVSDGLAVNKKGKGDG